MKTNHRNFLLSFDFYVLHFMWSWLDVFDIGRLDMAISESSLRIEFLASLRLQESFVIGDWNPSKNLRDEYLCWAFLRQLKIVDLKIESKI